METMVENPEDRLRRLELEAAADSAVLTALIAVLVDVGAVRPTALIGRLEDIEQGLEPQSPLRARLREQAERLRMLDPAGAPPPLRH